MVEKVLNKLLPLFRFWPFAVQISRVVPRQQMAAIEFILKLVLRFLLKLLPMGFKECIIRVELLVVFDALT